MSPVGLGAVSRGRPAFERQFPHVDAEALQLFSESCGDAPDEDVVSALAEMQREAREAAGQGGRAVLPTRGCVVTSRSAASSCAATASAPSRAAAEAAAEDDEEDLELVFEGGDDAPRVGTVLLLEHGVRAREGGDWEARGPLKGHAAVVVPSGYVLGLEPQDAAPTCFWVREYGVHELRLQLPGGAIRRCRFMVTTQLADYGECVDRFHDACDWVWDGAWTDALEEATMSLLVALDDYFTNYETTLRGNAMGERMLTDLRPSKHRLEKALAKVLEDHDAQSMGRVYGAVRSLLASQQMLDMAMPMLGGSASGGRLQDGHLYQCVVAFEQARFAAASEGRRTEVKKLLDRLIGAVDAQVAELHDGQARDFSARWRGGLRDTLCAMRDQDAPIHPLPFQQLREAEGGMMANMMKSVMDGFSNQGGAVQRSSTIEARCTLRPDATMFEAESRVVRWTESLVDDALSFGSPLAPFEVSGDEPRVRAVFAAMQSLLSLGFGYVTQGSRDEQSSSQMCALLDRVRATLPLYAAGEFLADKKRRDRLRDVCRVVRQAKKRGQRLSLTVNTDFAGALKGLREHHSDSWVGPSLESVWTQMASENRAFVFELWLHEDGAGDGAAAAEAAGARKRLIAADFGHPHTYGQAYYVTTRFFDREFRGLQPGFILAFSEAECLRRAGFRLWDLGGADHSPMMAYKPQVAVEMDRSDFLRRLRECRRMAGTAASPLGDADAEASAAVASAAAAEAARATRVLTDADASPPALGERVPRGVVVADITELDLFAASALLARDEKIKLAEDAAKKAAKKIQKPSKAQKAARKAEAAAAANGQSASAGTAADVCAPAARTEPTPSAAAANGTAFTPPQRAGATATVAAPAPAMAEAPKQDIGKDAAKQRFLEVYQKLVADGLTAQDAAARALQVVSATSA